MEPKQKTRVSANIHASKLSDTFVYIKMKYLYTSTNEYR